MLSKLFTITVRDAIHGVFTAFLGGITLSIGLVLQHVIQTQVFEFTTTDLKMAIAAGSFAGLTYIQKRFFSDEKGDILGIPLEKADGT